MISFLLSLRFFVRFFPKLFRGYSTPLHHRVSPPPATLTTKHAQFCFGQLKGASDGITRNFEKSSITQSSLSIVIIYEHVTTMLNMYSSVTDTKCKI